MISLHAGFPENHYFAWAWGSENHKKDVAPDDHLFSDIATYMNQALTLSSYRHIGPQNLTPMYLVNGCLEDFG